jgi:DNA repair protein RadC
MKTILNPEMLSDTELLSKIISGRDALLKSTYVLQHLTMDKLLESSFDELTNIYKLSKTQAENLSVVKSFRKRSLIKSELKVIICSKDVFDLMQPYYLDKTIEEFFCIFLNRRNAILYVQNISKGGISGTVTDVRVIFKSAISKLASGLIVSHNHPSGNFAASDSDTKITQKIKEAGALLDIQLLDHVICTSQDYYSFADNGLL